MKILACLVALWSLLIGLRTFAEDAVIEDEDEGKYTITVVDGDSKDDEGKDREKISAGEVEFRLHKMEKRLAAGDIVALESIKETRETRSDLEDKISSLSARLNGAIRHAQVTDDRLDELLDKLSKNERAQGKQ